MRLEKQLKKFDVKNKLLISYCQTNSTVVSDGATQTLKTNDTPCEPLLQKFGSQVSFTKSQSMPTLYFEYELNEKVKCSICGLPFDSTIELADHDKLYQYYRRTCYTSWGTFTY